MSEVSDKTALTVFDLITAPALITAPLTFYYIFTYHRPLDDLLELVVENKFM